MRKLANYILVLLFLLYMNYPVNVFARPGCCSWHGGESGCSGNQTVCADGTISSCPCDGTSSDSSYSSISDNNYNDSNSNSDSDSDDSNSTVMFWVILIGGFILFSFISDWWDSLKYEKMKKEKERERLELQQIEEQNLEKAQELKQHIINGENINVLFQNVSVQILKKLTSDDIVEIINACVLNKNDLKFMINKLIEIYDYDLDILKMVCERLSRYNCLKQNQKLYNYQRFTIEYILKMTDCNYYNIFIQLLNNNEISFLKKILKENLKCTFNFDNSESKILYDCLCNINDLDLLNLISTNNRITYKFIEVMSKNLETKNYKNLKIYFILYQDSIYFDKYCIEYIFDLLTKYKDVEALKIYLSECNEINAFLQKYGVELIYLSIRRLCVEIIEYVLTNYKGINLNVLIDGRTPLIYACYRKSYRIVKAFLDYGVDVNFKDSQNNCALAFACKVKSLKICKILIEHGAMLYNEYNMEAIKKAIKKRDIYELPYVSVYNIYGTRKNKY